MPAQKYPVVGKYIDPLVDFAFKKIFGSEPNKDLLIAFLNEVFSGRKHITDLSYSKSDHPGDNTNEGGAIFDLLCTGDYGEQFIIEVQRSSQQYFKERALFYTSRLISGQAPKGGSTGWKYDLKEVYLVALLEEFMLPENMSQEYLHYISLCNEATGEVFYNKLNYIYIELFKFVKAENDLQTDLDRWLYTLKHMSSMNNVPDQLRKPLFEKLFNIAAYSNLTKEDKMDYDRSLMHKWDNENVLDYAIKQGIEQGIEKGKHEEAVTIARELKNEGLPNEFIAKTTRLSIEEIEKL